MDHRLIQPASRDQIVAIIRQRAERANHDQNLTEVRRAKPFNIKNFWLFNPKSDELRVSDHCPRLERIRLDFVFQDMSFELDVNPLAAFKHLHTLDLNFYDNHRYFVNILPLTSRGETSPKRIFWTREA